MRYFTPNLKQRRRHLQKVNQEGDSKVRTTNINTQLIGDADDSNEQDSKNEVLPTVESFKDSIVWIHFTKDPDFKENKKATCKHCSKVYVYSGAAH
ncbi:unnamed protein product [Rhizophagus irregularis]|nr:unnamed protein product [Rhizophagus irregularis]